MEGVSKTSVLSFSLPKLNSPFQNTAPSFSPSKHMQADPMWAPKISPKFTKIRCRLSEGEQGFNVISSERQIEDYNTAMKKMMWNPYEYHHDLGMNYTLITENLIVGSQPQKIEDIDHLKEEHNVGYILNLQQDRDVEYWGIDLRSIIQRCKELGIRHMRRPAKDFDPESLRHGLPKAVSALEWAISEGNGRVYVHCTAGLGRAPAVSIAYIRAIRGATYDLAKNEPWKEPFESLPEHAFEDIADWERELIQDRVRALRES
ncbi:Phosphoglucan phosphatase LSF2- chloroplastic [Striga hermonthica]|uniref:Phosphoglucan phosphatase LSF2- chloroplastic n=1 Tax=Striga hermonthica TaxID=68872 RepID=A0A9N7RLN8_STRHE|nr:Phosphoglucan phosphatase LSF2- chloroplastic [Striga hermonthica]